MCAWKKVLACPRCPCTNPSLCSYLFPPPSVLSVRFVSSLFSGYHFLIINVISTGTVLKKSEYLQTSYLNWAFISAIKYSWEFFYRKTLRYSLILMCVVCLFICQKRKTHNCFKSPCERAKVRIRMQLWQVRWNWEQAQTAFLMLQMHVCFYGTAQADLLANVRSIFIEDTLQN